MLGAARSRRISKGWGASDLLQGLSHPGGVMAAENNWTCSTCVRVPRAGRAGRRNSCRSCRADSPVSPPAVPGAAGRCHPFAFISSSEFGGVSQPRGRWARGASPRGSSSFGEAEARSHVQHRPPAPSTPDFSPGGARGRGWGRTDGGPAALAGADSALRAALDGHSASEG